MIIKGKSRAGPRKLAAHLGNAEKNERVSVLEARGTAAQDLEGALLEMEALSLGTRCQKPLYHAAISPEPPHRLSPEQRTEAINALEEKLGLTGHARLVVMHEKLGREHIHVVWSRIDPERLVSISDSHNYRKHEEVARHLERRFGHERVQGAHHEREGVERPDRTLSAAEMRQEERTGVSAKNVKAKVTAAYHSSDNAYAFAAALADAGYLLLKGDRRDFVIMDHKGGVHSLARRIDGTKAAELRQFMAPIDRESLPSVDEVKELLRWKREARAEANLEKGYSRSEDYVTQTQTALKDFIARQKKLDKAANRDSVWDKMERREKEREAPKGNQRQKRKDDDRFEKFIDRDRDDRRRDREANESQRERPRDSRPIFGDVEMTEAQQRRMERLLGREGGRANLRDPDKPDRQREAPGGGRSRSR